ncbi:hypothetical protein F7725_027764, partial [Dissostichus mawsoni]
MSGNSKRYLEASGEWELVDILGETSILKFGIDQWDIITIWVVIRRQPLLYVVNLLIPSSFLMLIDIMSFYLPPHSVDRASFKMTLILGYTVFLLIMNDLLPSTANGTPIIGIYFSVCLALMVISLLETVIITNVLHHSSMKSKAVPNWVRVVVLKHIANLICTNGQRTSSRPLNHRKTNLKVQIATQSRAASMPELKQICQYLGDLRAHLISLQKENELTDQWCQVGYVLDFLLFRVYLLLISCYAMEWNIEGLSWDDKECGTSRVSVPREKLWIPDVHIAEFVDDDVSQACPYVYVNHTGHIRWDRMLRLVSSCNLEIFSFPFDVQNCSFTFGSYMHTIRDVRVGPALTFEEMSGNSKRYLEASGEWELVDILGETSILKFGIDQWDIITIWVVIKRRPVLYVVNLLIPSSFLMLIDIMSFYLPPHSVDRASFKMTLILGYTVFLLIMNDLLPSTANGTPIIGIYFSVCLALMVISLLETVIITNVLHHSSMKSKEVPNWVRVVVLKHIANLICYKWPEDVQPPSEPQEDKPQSSNSNSESWNIQPAIETPATHPNTNEDLSISGRPSCPSLSLQKENELTDQWCQVGYVLDFALPRLSAAHSCMRWSSSACGEEKSQSLTTLIWQVLEWNIEGLSWDDKECGTSRVSVPREKLWIPDVHIAEFMTEDKSPKTPYVYINNTGHVFDDKPIAVISSCILNIYSFPFDIQNCSLTFGSYLHFNTDIRMVQGSSSEEILEESLEVSKTNGEWVLIGVHVNPDAELVLSEGSYSEIKYYIILRRRPILYVVNLLIPSCFLITVDLFSFMLPPHSVDRSSFKMTLILGYTVFLLIMNDLLPTTGETTPLINVFFSLSLALMVASLLETVLITYVHFSSSQYSAVPHWLSVIVLQYLAVVVCLPPKKKSNRVTVFLSPAKEKEKDFSFNNISAIHLQRPLVKHLQRNSLWSRPGRTEEAEQRSLGHPLPGGQTLPGEHLLSGMANDRDSHRPSAVRL